jgi:hypothetical protein
MAGTPPGPASPQPGDREAGGGPMQLDGRVVCRQLAVADEGGVGAPVS